MAFVIFGLGVEPVGSQRLLDFVGGKHANRTPVSEVGHRGKGR
jgi:hypothetical protein